jgi:prolyl-tRNA editing enzyme YbaK/EbsC (Cys-tRNA(Pro) deacylase)
MATGRSLRESARRVQAALQRLGLKSQVVELPKSTRTAQEAAQAINCDIGQIAKSLVFKTSQTERPLLVITSGSNRVNEQVLAEHVGDQVVIADADYVRKHTGFAIGGVPPFGYSETIPTFIDRDLLDFKEIWAAAGTPHAVFMLTGEELINATGGTVIEVARRR